MYYQVYNTKTGETYMTCPDHESALSMLHECNNPHYFDINDQVYDIRAIDKTEHPLYGEPGFEVVQEMDKEADDYDPEDEWVG